MNYSCMNNDNSKMIETSRLHNYEQTILDQLNNVDILFKGIKRKVNSEEYSKLKQSFKLKSKQNKDNHITTNSIIKMNKINLNFNKFTNSNEIDIEQAHQNLLYLKQNIHTLRQQNDQLIRRIKKQQKIQDIYMKRVQNQELRELDYYKIMEIKLLLQVQNLQNIYEEKELNLHELIKNKKNKKYHPKDDIFQKRVKMYQTLLDSEKDLKWIRSEKQKNLTEKYEDLQNIHQKYVKMKHDKVNQNEYLAKLNKQVKEKKDKLKMIDQTTKRQQIFIGNPVIMSLFSSNQKTKDSQNIKNNTSTFSSKNRSNNMQQIQNEITMITSEYEKLNNEIQEFMNEKIKRKILIRKQINQYEEKEITAKNQLERKCSKLIFR